MTDDLYLPDHVREALATAGETADLSIDVRLIDNHLYVSGAAGTEEQLAAVLRIVRDVAGEVPVESDLTIDRFDEGGGQEDIA